jgi:hypothetical protein
LRGLRLVRLVGGNYLYRLAITGYMNLAGFVLISGHFCRATSAGQTQVIASL